ncbi:TIGR03862 family flavoprotein, partial [Herbaspirillum sp. B65]|uniref:TIGR03862 family flavoprotein n=1 Tax=Herbaspirillum sp. B65 TaxID=137708 RepID=UPI0005C838C3
MQTLPTLAPGSSRVAVIGAGPAGLMAAEVLAAHGVAVDVYDAMPSAGRKFLLAGRGGMNITHSEAQPDFLPRYGKRREQVAPFVRRFDGEQLRAWIHELGIETFVGSSGRVFPREMKAAPLLRAWLHRLRQAGVQFHMRHRWLGWQEDGALRLAHPEGEIAVRPDAVVLALGGGSWPRLGSDGSWVPLLQARQVEVAPLLPSNCGFELDWSAHFRERFAGEPVKPVVASTAHASGGVQNRRGEFIVTAEGIEGSLVYAMSAALRDTIAAEGSARLYLDLLPDWPLEKVEAELAHPRGARSLSSHLQSRLHLKGVKAGLCAN